MTKPTLIITRTAAISSQDFLARLLPGELYRHIEKKFETSPAQALQLLSAEAMVNLHPQELTNLIGKAAQRIPDEAGKFMLKNSELIFNRVGPQTGEYLFTYPGIVSDMSPDIQEQLLTESDRCIPHIMHQEHHLSVGHNAG